MSTITTTGGNFGFVEGDMVCTYRPDPNKWRRFWRWVTFRNPPTIKEQFVITSIQNGTTFNVR